MRDLDDSVQRRLTVGFDYLRQVLPAHEATIFDPSISEVDLFEQLVGLPDDEFWDDCRWEPSIKKEGQ